MNSDLGPIIFSSFSMFLHRMWPFLNSPTAWVATFHLPEITVWPSHWLWGLLFYDRDGYGIFKLGCTKLIRRARELVHHPAWPGDRAQGLWIGSLTPYHWATSNAQSYPPQGSRLHFFNSFSPSTAFTTLPSQPGSVQLTRTQTHALHSQLCLQNLALFN